MVERQELDCHACGRYVQFDMDMSINGNHVLNCPNCGHEHCRVVRDGRITGDRWDSRNARVAVSMSTATYSVASTYSTASTSTVFLYASWSNTASTF